MGDMCVGVKMERCVGECVVGCRRRGKWSGDYEGECEMGICV